jgi:hypothetical protein
MEQNTALSEYLRDRIIEKSKKGGEVDIGNNSGNGRGGDWKLQIIRKNW